MSNLEMMFKTSISYFKILLDSEVSGKGCEENFH
jgi:hypothetical protein